jgi:hypothetical protein
MSGVRSPNRVRIERAMLLNSQRPDADRSGGLGPPRRILCLGAGALGLLLLASGCTAPDLKALLPLQPAPETTDNTGSLATPSAAYETAAVVSGTPTDVYALVARGVLNCWFGAGGPLKASHVFQAEAEPPSKGGTAEIVIHERDQTLRDKRGIRAYRIAFTSEAGGVRVGMTALRFEGAAAQAMAKDVEGWAKGGAGCHLRAILAPPPPPSKTAKGTPKAAKAAKAVKAAPGKR